MEINKDEGIKKATEDQVPATEDILQLDHNLLTPTEIEAFKMIELARIQNKYLTRENILLKEHIIALKGIIRKLDYIGLVYKTSISHVKALDYIGLYFPLLYYFWD